MDAWVKNTTSQKLLPLYSIFSINVLLFFYFLITNRYPYIFVLIHIISVLILWFWIAFQKTICYKRITVLDSSILVCLFLLALCVYLYKIDVITPGIQGDELTIAKASEQILSSSQLLPFVPVNLGHPTPLLYLTGISIKTFGRSIMAIRLPYVFFGALSIAAFYLLLRLFFTKPVSIAGSLLMLFSYPFIIVSRLAYEVTPEIFFQIVTVIFLYLAWRTKDVRYYTAVGLTLGMGLYTYLGFRTFLILVLFLTFYFIRKTVKAKKTQFTLSTLVVGSFFIATVPFCSYGITHMQDLMTRTASLSAFSQGYSPIEIGKELLANTQRLTHLFFMGDPNTSTNGDTNYERNPSNVSMFDLGTFAFFLIGLYCLFKSNKKLFLLILVLSLSPLINDIFVIEKIPMALNPYGIGHPNTVRIAGLIPIIYFTIAYGLSRLKILLNMGEMKFTYIPYILVAIIIVYNWNLYFQQPSHTFYSEYIMNNNGSLVMNIVTVINNSTATKVGISPDILSDARFSYFLKKGITVRKYAPKNVNEAITDAQKNQLTVFYALQNTKLALQMLTQSPLAGVQINTLSSNAADPNHTIYAIILKKRH